MILFVAYLRHAIKELRFRGYVASNGVTGGSSAPSREGPGVGHKIVSDTRQMTNKRKKMKDNELEKRKMCKEKTMKERERE